jgi:hypothetical protein
MSYVVATTWGELPDYATVIERFGTMIQLGCRLSRDNPVGGLAWFESAIGTLVRGPGEPVALVVPGAEDAVVNLMRAGFDVAAIAAETLAQEGTSS